MARWSGARAVPPEILSSIPSTYAILAPRDPTHSWTDRPTLH